MSNNFIERIKIEKNLFRNKKSQREDFMKNLKKNPKLLENFSNDRLKKILQYYLEENEKKREILKKLTN